MIRTMWTLETRLSVTAGAVVRLPSPDSAVPGGWTGLPLSCLGLRREAERAMVS